MRVYISVEMEDIGGIDHPGFLAGNRIAGTVAWMRSHTWP